MPFEPTKAPSAAERPEHEFSAAEMMVLWCALQEQPGGTVVYNRIKNALDLLDVALERLTLYRRTLETIANGGSKSLAREALGR